MGVLSFLGFGFWFGGGEGELAVERREDCVCLCFWVLERKQ